LIYLPFLFLEILSMYLIFGISFAFMVVICGVAFFYPLVAFLLCIIYAICLFTVHKYIRRNICDEDMSPLVFIPMWFITLIFSVISLLFHLF
jgi:hypothetical protein